MGKKKVRLSKLFFHPRVSLPLNNEYFKCLHRQKRPVQKFEESLLVNLAATARNSP